MEVIRIYMNVKGLNEDMLLDRSEWRRCPCAQSNIILFLVHIVVANTMLIALVAWCGNE